MEGLGKNFGNAAGKRWMEEFMAEVVFKQSLEEESAPLPYPRIPKTIRPSVSWF